MNSHLQLKFKNLSHLIKKVMNFFQHFFNIKSMERKLFSKNFKGASPKINLYFL